MTFLKQHYNAEVSVFVVKKFSAVSNDTRMHHLASFIFFYQISHMKTTNMLRSAIPKYRLI